MRIPLLFLLLLFLSACGSESTTSTDQAEISEDITAQLPKSNVDSLRNVFQSFYDKRKDWYPAKFIFEEGKLNPVDEALTDTSFFIFRESLLKSIKEKDAFGLLEKTSQNIKYSFGEDGGLAGFVQLWELDSPEGIERSLVWNKLENVLTKGGSFSEDGKTFTAPYYYDLFPDKYDAFTHGVVIGTGVRMRTAPDLRAPVVKSVSYEIIEIVGKTATFETIGGEEHPWVQVKLLDGREGYIWGKFIGSPIDFRIGFSKQTDGSWLMHFFVAGD